MYTLKFKAAGRCILSALLWYFYICILYVTVLELETISNVAKENKIDMLQKNWSTMINK